MAVTSKEEILQLEYRLPSACQLYRDMNFFMKIDEQKFWISKFSEFYINNKVLRKKLSWNPEI